MKIIFEADMAKIIIKFRNSYV